ncbi:DUF6435 family protein [Aestuariibacter halophilus]|uniref:DUF6435 family protein n=1 Tax=Fluctibacter halophilus TaxID=226011 RepID=A0ABS8GE79_9ALTE|nr:DUF6435 family protein [Aestuariibacter halophilus]MCC2618099.1 DUF6435 family protein [Aestuariibacter halophilus]
MFGWLKSDPAKKLRAEYNRLLEQGMHAQRNGDMRAYAALTEKAEALWADIIALENKGQGKDG